jgi:16S rRNA processing protein RimM
MVGRVGRAHGLRGEVAVDLFTDRDERAAPGSEFATSAGDLLLAEARPHSGRWLFRFEGHTRREDAERIQGVELWSEPIEDPDALWVHELIGCRVMDGEVDRGTVVAVSPNPASDLLELDSGALVPVTFVRGRPTEADDGTRLLVVDVPAGLFDL